MDPQTLTQLIQSLPFTAASDDGLSVITGPVRLPFVNFEKPTSPPNTNKEPRFNCFAMVPRGADYALLTAARDKAWMGSQWRALTPGNDPLKLPASMISKPKDGTAGKPWEGSDLAVIGFNAETKTPVYLMDMFQGPDGKPLPLDVTKAKAGYWYRLKVRAQAYNVGQTSGVKFWLQAAQLIALDKEIVMSDRGAGFTAHAQAPAGNAPAAMPSQGFGAPAANNGFGGAPAPAANGFAGAPQMPSTGGFRS